MRVVAGSVPYTILRATQLFEFLRQIVEAGAEGDSVAATGDKRTVIADPRAQYYGTEMHGGELTPGEGARVGKVDFDTRFAANHQETR